MSQQRWKYYLKDQPRYSEPCLVAGWDTTRGISHFPLACLLYEYSMIQFQPVRILQRSKRMHMLVCIYNTARFYAEGRRGTENTMPEFWLKRACLPCEQLERKTKNLGLVFHPSLIWQQCVAPVEAEQRLESTTWPGWHLFTRASSQLLWELTVSYGNQRSALIKWCFCMFQNYLSRPGYSLDPLPMVLHIPSYPSQLLDCCCRRCGRRRWLSFSSIKGFPN